MKRSVQISKRETKRCVIHNLGNMYRIPPLSAGQSHNAGWLADSHVFLPTTDLYTAERHLLLKCLTTLLYAEQKRLGMLNPFVAEYYPPTDKDINDETFKNFEPLNNNHRENMRSDNTQCSHKSSEDTTFKWKTVTGSR